MIISNLKNPEIVIDRCTKIQQVAPFCKKTVIICDISLRLASNMK